MSLFNIAKWGVMIIFQNWYSLFSLPSSG